MPSLNFQRRHSDTPRGAMTSHQCAYCREDLRLVRQHLSPSRLGAQMATEFYQCRACDSGYAFNPATGKWKAWMADEA
jgi:uncharacterized protein with PIN domain